MRTIYVVLDIDRYGSPFVNDVLPTIEAAEEQLEALKELGREHATFDTIYIETEDLLS